MPRHLLRALPAPDTDKPINIVGPGSNGFFRRQQFWRPGTYTWVADRDGRIKVQAIGAAAGANGFFPGASGGYGEKIATVKKGDVVTIVVGTGGVGIASSTSASSGGGTSTSVSIPGLAALNIVGASGHLSTVASMTSATPGNPAGPWDNAYTGGRSAAGNQGSACSASPFGPGKGHPNTSSRLGGVGWAGPSPGSGDENAGGGTHRPASRNSPGRGLSTINSSPSSSGSDGPSQSFWDLADADSSGGSTGASGTKGGDAGPGAGGGQVLGSSSGGTGGVSLLGGGAGRSDGDAPKSGNGGGGGASAGVAGDGGDAFVQLFWDEVA